MWITVVLMGFLSLAVPSWAAVPTQFVWDRNVETDMLEYRVYTCSSSATCVPNVSIGTLPQPPVGTSPTFAIPANSQGRAAVTAVDLVGNESSQSNVVNFDRLAPSAPANARTQ